MLRQTKQSFSAAEYLAMEVVAEYKSEYYDGEIFAMSGGTPDHSSIAVNVVSALSQLLQSRPCRVFNSDMRLNIPSRDMFTYPDAMVICGQVRLAKNRNDTVTNPLLIVEVLSESTRSYHRGAKFDFYKQIPSLKEYVLIESENVRVECYRRQESGLWLFEARSDLDATMKFESVECEIPLRQIYAKVSWLA